MTDTTTAALLGAGALAGSMLAVLTLAGIVWRFALPWLREQLLEPVQATKEQVTNSHDTNLRDDLTEAIKLGRENRDTLGRHLQWSSEETSRLWVAISHKADRP